ncbi:MAG: hypothetical protein LBG15_10280 [Dysgonamonadaceae bacterium]|jgi:hypothetical protein|nr:hypothetical protein [Dysgonamonadaceae bacterium]
MKTLHFIWHLLLGVVIIVGIGALVMLLWNWLMPVIWGWAAINLWQALGLFALCRILFGGFGGSGKIFAFGGRHFHKRRIHEKWLKMTPEEREEFIRHRHFGHGFGHFNPHFFDKEGESEKKD